MRHPIVVGTLLTLAMPCVLTAQHHPGNPQDNPEAEQVTRAALDYLEGFYEGDPAKIRRSVRPEVVKYGFYKGEGADSYDGTAMSFEEMIAFADRVRESGRTAPSTAPKEVILLDIQDKTATVKVIAWWGMDYLQLAKYDGEWMILHVLWQSPPPTH